MQVIVVNSCLVTGTSQTMLSTLNMYIYTCICIYVCVCVSLHRHNSVEHKAPALKLGVFLAKTKFSVFLLMGFLDANAM